MGAEADECGQAKFHTSVSTGGCSSGRASGGDAHAPALATIDIVSRISGRRRRAAAMRVVLFELLRKSKRIDPNRARSSHRQQIDSSPGHVIPGEVRAQGKRRVVETQTSRRLPATAATSGLMAAR
jgi:hypothetical protein